MPNSVFCNRSQTTFQYKDTVATNFARAKSTDLTIRVVPARTTFCPIAIDPNEIRIADVSGYNAKTDNVVITESKRRIVCRTAMLAEMYIALGIDSRVAIELLRTKADVTAADVAPADVAIESMRDSLIDCTIAHSVPAILPGTSKAGAIK